MKITAPPIIDVEPLIRKTSATADCVRALDKALYKTGFLYVKNHGIPDDLQTKLFEISRRFFAEDENFKMRVSMKRGGPAWRGYFPVGGELTSGRPDQKEGIYFGVELSPNHPEVLKKTPLHGANLWPDDPRYTEMKSLVLDFMARLTELGQTLMGGIAMGLGLQADYFRKRFTDSPTTLFRIFNYPKHVWRESEDEWGVREHTDMGFLTMLAQDQSGGLQVKTDAGWIDVPPVKNTFVVNIGDMLEVWTHGIYKATPHRVRNQGAGDRLSLPFFFDPNWRATLEPIDEGQLPADRLAQVASKTQERWDGLNLRSLSGKITYGEFVWNKVKNVFPKLAGEIR